MASEGVWDTPSDAGRSYAPRIELAPYSIIQGYIELENGDHVAWVQISILMSQDYLIFYMVSLSVLMKKVHTVMVYTLCMNTIFLLE